MSTDLDERQIHAVRAYACVYAARHALQPPARRRVSESAAENLVIAQPGSAGGLWNPDETPYMVEPMDMLASRLIEALCFVGPARTGKTQGLLLGGLTHAVINDPGDTLFIQMSKEKAREFSKTDVDRALRNSPSLAAMRSGRDVDSNTFDTMFRHGMWMRIAWPTVSNVSGSTYRYVFVTDYDRIENAENVDGEGPLFMLALKRTATFMSRGMCAVESSPGINITDPNWKPATAHEAPPVTGILGIYNRSNRKRWYWQCPDCRDWFEAAPGLGLFRLPGEKELLERVRTSDIQAMAAEYGSRIICPHCGVLIPVSEKKQMNRGGRWLAEGQSIDVAGVIHGPAPASTIGGYWLGGVAAAYQTWRSLVERYLQGLRDYALTGSEETLKTTTNTDQGMPYMPRYLVEARSTHSDPGERTEPDLERFVVPDDTRCVVVAVDVQGGANARFVVQAHAVQPFMEQTLIDRYEIKDSKRPGMGSEFAPIDPASYAEDWDVLTERIVRATYRTSDPDREIRVKLCVVDSGGEEGVTEKAYAWYRRLRAEGLHTRVRLYKGGSEKKAPLIRETLVGHRDGREKGDISLLLCNTNLLSDEVDNGLRRAEQGPGYVHFPTWLPRAAFDELKAEVRGPNGVWQKVRKRNETFDLCRMIRAGMLALGLDKVKDWDDMQVSWLRPLPNNTETVTREERRAMKAAPPVAVARPRRVAHSAYLA